MNPHPARAAAPNPIPILVTRNASNVNNADKLCEFDFGECRTNFLPLLHEMNRIACESGDLSALLETLLDIMERHLKIRRAVVSLIDPSSTRALIHKSRGLSEAEATQGVYAPEGGVPGKVMATGEAVVVPRLDAPSAMDNTPPNGAKHRPERERALLCVPIRYNGKTLGALSAERRYKNQQLLHLDADILAILATAAAQTVALYLAEKVRKVALEDENRSLKHELAARFAPENIIGQSRPMQKVYALIERVARARTTVLLLGESGVGKERVASAIHYQNARADAPFIRFNCAALPESIIESELFGHEKGAFTGAVARRRGRFEEADGGTLFLDEVGELAPAMQVKLLRVLQEKRFERVGGNVTLQVDLRIIAATNRDLKQMVAEGAFREDLYYRLNVFPITLPPLRARGNDIALLAWHFVRRFSDRMGIQVAGIAPQALAMMMCYHWPGNVRELENTVERAMNLASGEYLTERELDPEMLAAGAAGALVDAKHYPVNRARAQGRPHGPLAFAGAERSAHIANHPEEDAIRRALSEARGNVTKAANLADIPKRTLYRRIKQYKIDLSEFRAGSPC
jgi:Nif-specific regulatory protein